MNKVLRLKSLTNQVLKPISYYMKRFDKAFSMGMHQHAYFEIMYAFQGSFKLEYVKSEDSPVETFFVKTGQFVFLDAMVFHRMVTDVDDEIFIYNIEFEAVRSEQYNPYRINAILPINLEQLIAYSSLKNIAFSPRGFSILLDVGRVELYLRTLIAALTDKTDSLEQVCAVRCNLLLLLTEISKCANLEGGGSLSYIRKANQYIHGNFNSKLSVNDVASYVGINPSYLQRQFRKYTGNTILATINRLRIQKSVEFLHSTNLSVGEIASQSGFSNKAQFNYEFKKFLGVPPSDYRRARTRGEIDHHYFQYDSRSIPVEGVLQADRPTGQAKIADRELKTAPPPDVKNNFVCVLAQNKEGRATKRCASLSYRDGGTYAAFFIPGKLRGGGQGEQAEFYRSSLLPA